MPNLVLDPSGTTFKTTNIKTEHKPSDFTHFSEQKLAHLFGGDVPGRSAFCLIRFMNDSYDEWRPFYFLELAVWAGEQNRERNMVWKAYPLQGLLGTYQTIDQSSLEGFEHTAGSEIFEPTGLYIVVNMAGMLQVTTRFINMLALLKENPVAT